MTGENEYGVEIKFHHIISDAWSIVTVFNMIQEYYHKIENDFDIDDDELSYFDVFEKNKINI